MRSRWHVAVLVCAAIAISYLDRQSLPVAVAAIQREIPLTNTQFGALTSVFLLAYAVMYAGGGAFIDRVWGLVGAKFLTDAAWFFYISWLPKYLYDARHFDVRQVGYYAWVPYAASGVGSLVGGWFSSRLIANGHSVNWSRKLVLGLSASMMPVIVFVTKVPVEWALLFFAIAFFGQQSWSTLVMIVPNRSLRPPRCRVGRRPRRIRRRDGRAAHEPRCRPAARRRAWLRNRVQNRRHAARDRVRRDPGDHSDDPRRVRSRCLFRGDPPVRITRYPHSCRRVARPDRPAAAALLHEPMDILDLPADSLAGFRFHGWYISDGEPTPVSGHIDLRDDEPGLGLAINEAAPGRFTILE